MQTGQQVSKAEEQQLKLSAQNDKNTPAAMWREARCAGPQHHTDLVFHVPYSAFPVTSVAIMLKNVINP